MRGIDPLPDSASSAPFHKSLPSSSKFARMFFRYSGGTCLSCCAFCCRADSHSSRGSSSDSRTEVSAPSHDDPQASSPLASVPANVSGDGSQAALGSVDESRPVSKPPNPSPPKSSPSESWA